MKKKLFLSLIFALLSLVALAGDLSELKNVDFNGRKAKIGFFIGSYDPIHLHHQQIAEQVQKLGGLDYLIIIPNDTAFHKPMVSPVNHRIKMLDIVFGDHDKIMVPLDREEFTYPLMKSVKSFLKDNIQDVEMVGVMGKDSAIRKNTQLASYVAGFDSWIIVEAEDLPGPVPDKLGGKPARVVKIQTSKEFPAAHSSAIRKFMLADPNAPFPGIKNMPIDERIYKYAQQNELYSKPHTFINKVKGVLGCLKMAMLFPVF